jgi:hypothetical protein
MLKILYIELNVLSGKLLLLSLELGEFLVINAAP